jgi:hypothetical protein
VSWPARYQQFIPLVKELELDATIEVVLNSLFKR